jgi:hypothetical protein
MKKLYIYRVRIEYASENSRLNIGDYYVEAPTQCSATTFTSLRSEVVNVIMVEQWLKDLPPQGLTFTTQEEC